MSEELPPAPEELDLERDVAPLPRAPRNHHGPEMKAAAAALLASGMGVKAVSAELGVHRSTLWSWSTSDDEFRVIRAELTTAAVEAHKQRLRALVGHAIDALEAGLRSTTRQQVVAVEGGYEIVDLRDNTLAVRTADQVLRRVGEFVEQADLNVGGQLEVRLAELDARGDADSD